MEIKEAFYDLFTDNPVNWVKWGVVFLILILGYVVAIPLYKKIQYRISWERKRDIARSRNHVIEATLLKKHPTGEVARYNWYATYQYSINGEEKQYKAYFKHPMTPPLKLSLYYLNLSLIHIFCSATGGLPPLVKRRQYYEALEVAA